MTKEGKNQGQSQIPVLQIINYIAPKFGSDTEFKFMLFSLCDSEFQKLKLLASLGWSQRIHAPSILSILLSPGLFSKYSVATMPLV